MGHSSRTASFFDVEGFLRLEANVEPQRASLTRHCKACLRSAMACSSDASRIISAHLSLSGGSSKPIAMAAFYPRLDAQGFRTPDLAQSRSIREQSVQLRWTFMYAWYSDSSLLRASIVSTWGRRSIVCLSIALSQSSRSLAHLLQWVMDHSIAAVAPALEPRQGHSGASLRLKVTGVKRPSSVVHKVHQRAHAKQDSAGACGRNHSSLHLGQASCSNRKASSGASTFV